MNKPHDVVLVWEGAGAGRSLGAASLFSFAMDHNNLVLSSADGYISAELVLDPSH